MGVKSFIHTGPPLVLIAIVCATAFLFPGDAPFISDEPTLLAAANMENHQPCELLGISLPFTPARVGLAGTRGVNYGPLPIWIYQLLLAITHDPITLVRMHAILFSGSTAIALVWLARSMHLSPWFAVFSMFSPWLWMFSRELWDNTFCIPLAGIGVAAYCDFLITRRRWPLLLAAICLGAMTLVHLMSVALVAAVFIHFVIFERRWLCRFWWGLLLVGILWACAFLPYLKALLFLYQPRDGAGESPWNGWWHPLLGGQLLTAFHWLDVTRPHLPLVFAVCRIISLLPNLAAWSGMALIFIRGRSRARRRSLTPVDHFAVLSLMIAGCQSLFDGIERLDFQPHYYNATWIGYVILAWYAVDALYRRAWKPAITICLPLAAYVASVLIVMGISIIWIHINGGTRSIDYGTVLQDQMRAVARIEKFSPDSPTDVTYLQWQNLPWVKRDLIALLPPPPEPRPLRRLLIRYRNEYPDDARISVEDFPIWETAR